MTQHTATIGNPMLALVSGMAQTPSAAAAMGRLPHLPACDLLLFGPAASHRSSLALHFALHHAACTRLPALFLCRQEGLEQAVPLLPHMWDEDDPALHLLHFKYISSHLDLQRFAACLHLLRGAHAAIVVEDLSAVVRTDDRSSLVRTLALLLEGVQAYRSSRGCCCPLMVTDSSEEPRRPRYIYDRWFPLTLALTPAASPPAPSGCFCLAVAAPPSSSSLLQPSRAAAGGPDAADAPPAPPSPLPAAPRVGPCCVYRAAGSHLVLEAVVELPAGQQPQPQPQQPLVYDNRQEGLLAAGRYR
ncbi:hypothetical protein Agub_g1642 [Astrephomene gubernaculifera]|uniref:Uncharacterized protein n=1 Tax=Astrephomene gubernaculifera TaxID=47775 RepID=A0AAD3DIE5_9CHLO|nr:hypothetical protein Agub_g1642 [Astrephomene gubernaculifera]